MDTSSVACTVAIVIDGSFFSHHEEQPREHTRLLLPMIRDILRESAATLNDLDAIVLGNGPGSFIGLRIAASVAQGLAHGARLTVIPVSSLAAIAAQVFAESEAEEVVVAQDAHMGEAYIGHFARDKQDLPLLISDERVHGQAPIVGLDPGKADVRVAAGYGWHRYPKLMLANAASFGAQANNFYPNASHMLRLVKTGNAVLPKDIRLAYLRQNVAQKPQAAKQ